MIFFDFYGVYTQIAYFPLIVDLQVKKIYGIEYSLESSFDSTFEILCKFGFQKCGSHVQWGSPEFIFCDYIGSVTGIT